MSKNRQPDDPGVNPLDELSDSLLIRLAESRSSEKRYKTRWTYYHCALVFGVWVIAACTTVALFDGWGSLG